MLTVPDIIDDLKQRIAASDKKEIDLLSLLGQARGYRQACADVVEMLKQVSDDSPEGDNNA